MEIIYLDRDEKGNIICTYACQQYPNQEGKVQDEEITKYLESIGSIES